MKQLLSRALIALFALTLLSPVAAQTIDNPTPAGLCYTLPPARFDPVTFSNTTAEQTYATVTLPARAPGLNGRVSIVTVWSMTGSTNLKTFRTKLGGATMVAVPLSTATVVAAQLLTRFHNRNSYSAQVTQPSSIAGFNSSTTAVATLSVDETVEQPITITGQMASASETLTLEDREVTVCPG